MLEIESLHGGYRGTEILHGIDLTIPSGAVTVIAGPNGCGKSTLLRTVAGILPAMGGKIRLNGTDLCALSPAQRARQIAYLAQGRPVSDITVERMVLHGRFPYLSYPRHYGKQDLQIARRAMETMGIVELAHRNMGTLSGGQRQNVYIAMTLAQDTPLVLMDEPTTYLDIANQMQMMAQARFLAEAGKAVVLVLHDLSAALKCADSLVVMDRGKIVIQDTADAVFQSGCLDDVFGIRMARCASPDGWQYYYRERSRDDGLLSDVR